MKSQARVVVIGGGVVGCSVLYHLTRYGWTDVMLIERSELTSGSTWHAAGGFHTLNADTNIAALQGYTIRLYQELEELSDQSCGLHHVGGITIAGDPERLDYLKAQRAKHRHMGLDTHMIGPDEISEICPVISTEGVLGALYDPLDGHLDPAGTTQAYAIAARRQGAEIVLRNRVLELNRKPDQSWDVVSEQGTVNAEYVVNAGGLWAREVGEMVGVYHPLMAMEHQYLVTDDIPEVYEREGELPHVMDPGAMTYFRQEGRGLVLGIYEHDCDPWSVDRTPWDFGHELLPDNLERISGPLEAAFKRYPCLENAGIKRVINGPFTFAPDGNPLVGPVPGVPGYWCACAVMAGFSQGGGVGRTVAEWMIEGEPSSDVFAMDVARFGDWASRKYTQVKVVENYQRRFAVSFPNEELPAGRPLRTTPAYGMWAAQNAVFGTGYGLEHVNYFALPGEQPFEIPSFHRSNAFGPVGEECRAVRTAVGINEIHNFGKYEVSGPGAEDWLDYLLANRMPAVGRIVLSPMLAPSGRLIGDLTVSRLGGPSVSRSSAPAWPRPSTCAGSRATCPRPASACATSRWNARASRSPGPGPVTCWPNSPVPTSPTRTYRSSAWPRWRLAWPRPSSAASATPATWATRSTSRRNSSWRSTRRSPGPGRNSASGRLACGPSCRSGWRRASALGCANTNPITPPPRPASIASCASKSPTSSASRRPWPSARSRRPGAWSIWWWMPMMPTSGPTSPFGRTARWWDS